MRVICAKSGKSTFGTVGTATAAAGHTIGPTVVRVYRCEFCGFYHLTTRAYDTTRRTRRPRGTA